MASSPSLLSLAGKFRAAGFRLWEVGGSVRSRVLGEAHVGETDLATDATPAEMRGFCAVAGEMGSGFGTLVLREGGEAFECTAFRRDVGVRDGRRPASVEFSRDIREDAARRDFTFNAAYFDPLAGEFFDPFGGAADLKSGRIRFVGDAAERLREDSLRALRYVRFSARYGLAGLTAERAAVAAAMPAAAGLSAERVTAELEKMMPHGSRAAAFRDLAELGFLAAFLPELDALRRVPGGAPHHLEGPVWDHTLLVLSELDAAARGAEAASGKRFSPWETSALAWAALFHDSGKARTFSSGADGRPHYYGHESASGDVFRSASARLRLPARISRAAESLVRSHMLPGMFPELSLARAADLAADPSLARLFALAVADLRGRLPRRDDRAERALSDLALCARALAAFSPIGGAEAMAAWPDARGAELGERIRGENRSRLSDQIGRLRTAAAPRG